MAGVRLARHPHGQTVRADGIPRVAPVWFVCDGDDVVFNTGKAIVQWPNLARAGRVTLCGDDENSSSA